jgi:hypothetical protein
MTNQPTPLTDFKDLDRMIEEVHNPQTAADLDFAEANVKLLEELRRKLSAPRPLPQKSKWRFW